MIHALGEKKAAEVFADAAQLLETYLEAMQLRFLQTMTEFAAEQNSTLIFPLPMEILRVLDPLRTMTQPCPAWTSPADPSISIDT